MERAKQEQDLTKRLGLAIGRRRKSLGLTQKALGALADVGPNFVGQIEAGKATAHFSKVLSVLQALGLQFTLENGKNGIEIKNVSS